MSFFVALRHEVEITVSPLAKEHDQYPLSLLDHHRAVP
jgi:hypothetical protein